MSQWTLRRRLTVSLVAAGLALLAVIIAAVVLLAQVRTLQDEVVDDYFRATTLSSDQFLLAVDAETAVRGFALTGDESLLEPLTPRTPPAGPTLAELVSKDDDVVAALDKARVTARTWYEDFVQPLIAQVKAGGPESLRPGQIEEGKRLFDAVRVDFGDFRTELIAARAHALADLRDRTRALAATLAGSALVALAIAGVLALMTRGWVTKPLAALGEDVRRVRSGEVDHEVSPVGPPEIRAVAADVDDMRRALVVRLAEVEEAGREIENARVQLEEQAEELARSNRDLEQFAYVASHDLQEPLRKVASFCQLLQRRYGGELDERADQYIDFAVDGAKRMQQLINDLLAFSRVGRMATAEMEVVPMEAAVERATSSLSTAIEESAAVIEHDPLPEVRGEPTLLAQLLQNLIGNAVKFRGEAPPHVRITCREADGAYELAVLDTGIGIEPRYAEKVFVIFQRLHAKDAYEGTGIGLAMCKRIVEHHGGRIWIEPGPDGGTAVRFTLPVPVTDEPDVTLQEETA
jgi:signal transduction histidine kinase